MTATTAQFASEANPSVGTDIRLQDIIKTLPKECFQKNHRKAWTSLMFSIAAVGLGYAGIAALPWFFLPITWVFTGTALTGFFVLAHDCGHRSFSNRRWINDWVGHLLMLPLMYPFHSWRILHNHHHVHTNKLQVDNAWHPWTTDAYINSPVLIQTIYRALRGRFWWLASIAHWGNLHFDLSQFSLRDRPKVKFSITLVAIFAAIFFPSVAIATGIGGVIKFWLLPWLVYHFWMSTFTLVHHTNLDIQFHPTETWNSADAQLSGTAHCSYPRWVELLCHDINVHVPHHISVAIPAYNLRMAHDSLSQDWGSYLKEHKFSWALMKDIVDYCHLYHPDEAYQPFRAINQTNR
ncbi:MAG: fatty acid desaturase [Elainellaceae cyanobacterium]